MPHINPRRRSAPRAFAGHPGAGRGGAVALQRKQGDPALGAELRLAGV